jgi:hypothetical protein
MEKTFEVTKEHLKTAKKFRRTSNTNCLLATAIKDAFPDLYYVNVDIGTGHFCTSNIALTQFEVDKTGQKLVKKYIHSFGLDLFRFTLPKRVTITY